MKPSGNWCSLAPELPRESMVEEERERVSAEADSTQTDSADPDSAV